MSFLAIPWIQTLLLILAIVAVVVELFRPTYGIAAGVAVVAFGLFFWGAISAGMANWMEVLLFVGGIGLLFVEATIEGFGLTGVAGLGMVGLGIVCASANIHQGLFSIVIALLAGAVVGALLVKCGYESRLMRRSVLKESLTGESGFIAKANRSELLGKHGVTLTVLRPSGTAEFDGMRQDVLTEGEFIEQGSIVEVIRTSNGQIIVRRVMNG